MRWKLWLGAAVAVALIVVVGDRVTKFSLGEMAMLAPIAVLTVGALAFLVVLWAKVIRDSLRGR